METLKSRSSLEISNRKLRKYPCHRESSHYLRNLYANVVLIIPVVLVVLVVPVVLVVL